MGIIREPIDMDFVIESRPLTKEEEAAISEFIRVDKKRREKTATSRSRKKLTQKPKELV